MEDRKTELERHVGWIDAALAGAEPPVVAGLLRERRLTLDHLAALGSVGSVRNDLADARQKRRATAAAAAQTAAKRSNKRSG